MTPTYNAHWQNSLKGRRFPGLDWLRFFMAVPLVALHCTRYYPDELKVLDKFAYLSTGTFFILSGFILMHVYASKIAEAKTSPQEFLTKRFAGIYGAHIVCLFAMGAIYLFNYYRRPEFGFFKEEMDAAAALSYLLQSVFLLQAWNSKFLWLNSPSWSISAILFFYIVFLLFSTRITCLKKPLNIFLVLWALTQVLPALDAVLDYEGIHLDGVLHRNPAVRSLEFLSGMVGYVICIRYSLIQRYRLKWLFFCVGIAAFVLAAAAAVHDERLRWFLHNGAILPFQLLLIISAAMFGLDNKPVLRKAGAYLGGAAISIFISHYFFINLLNPVARLINNLMYSHVGIGIYIPVGVKLPFYSFIPFIILVILLCLLAQRLVFSPVQNWLAAKLSVGNKKTENTVGGHELTRSS